MGYRRAIHLLPTRSVIVIPLARQAEHNRSFIAWSGMRVPVPSIRHKELKIITVRRLETRGKYSAMTLANKCLPGAR